MQGGSSQCGLFAVGFATSLCCGFNPAQVQYTQRIFRNHHIQSLQNKYYFIMQKKKVICNSSHKTRNHHNSLHLQKNNSWTDGSVWYLRDWQTHSRTSSHTSDTTERPPNELFDKSQTLPPNVKVLLPRPSRTGVL